MAQDIQRPQRRDFMKIVVIGPNAQIVDQKDWQSVTRGAEGKDFRKILKENNWTSTRVFDSEGYDQAIKSFREHSRSRSQETRKTLFQQAFEDAGVNPHPRIESALRTVLPLMDPENQEARVVRALGKIVSAVDSVMVEAKRDQKNGDKHPGAETDEEGHRVNQDGSVDKRTKGESDDKAQGQKTREDDGLQGKSEDKAGTSEKSSKEDDNSGTDGKRSSEKEDNRGNFVSKSNNSNADSRQEANV